MKQSATRHIAVRPDTRKQFLKFASHMGFTVVKTAELAIAALQHLTPEQIHLLQDPSHSNPDPSSSIPTA